MISGLYSALSGLLNFSKKTEITANNVANINTPGFKASRASMEGGPAQTISTAGGTAQVGRGVQLGSVDQNFSPGTFESTYNPTDLAIGGQGFFVLRQPDSSEADRYSRSGGFQFNQNGNLTNAAGQYVQGWSLDPATGEPVGSIGDINLGPSTPPTATNQIDMVVNLDSRIPPETNETNLFDAWDGRKAAAANPAAPIDPANYEYSTATTIYDNQGGGNEITVYFDRTTNPDQWEFLVTTNPLEDQRNIAPNQQAANAPFEQYSASSHKGSGALMYGTIQFSSAGQVQAIAAYNVPPDGAVAPALNDNRIVLSNTATTYSFPINATGDTVNQGVRLNFGARHNGDGNANFTPEALATTQYANTSNTIFQSSDGFAAGFLQSVSTDTNGVITGHYSNGQVIPRAQVALANFNNTAGLSMEGGNLFRATTESGAPITGAPGTAGLGTIAPNALEMSNVDLTEELPGLMLTKRYFQANLKIIEAQDEMLGNLIDTKS